MVEIQKYWDGFLAYCVAVICFMTLNRLISVSLSTGSSKRTLHRLTDRDGLQIMHMLAH